MERDLTSVYRSRIGAGAAAVMALATVVGVGLLALSNEAAILGGVVGVFTLVTLAALVVTGRPRAVAGLTVTFTLAATGFVLLAPTGSPLRDQYTPEVSAAVTALGGALSFLVPVVALLASYGAFVRERETGSVRFLLGLPNSRDDAYLGKLLSRTLVVLLPLLGGLLLAAGLVPAFFEGGGVVAALGIAVVSVPYVVLFVGIGLAASAYADTTARAVAVSVTAFLVLRVGWTAVRFLAVALAENPYPEPAWFFWMGRLNPINAYVRLTAGFAGALEYHPLLTHPDESVSTVATSPGVAAAVLLAWACVVPVVGLVLFRSRDLL